MNSRRDFLVGLFVLTALGIIIGTLIVTSGLGYVRYDIYMRTESAQDLTRDTRRPSYLQPGDTIDSDRRTSTMDKLGDVAEQLSVQVEAALKETRRLLAGTNRAVERTDSMIATATPMVERALRDMAGSLER